MTVTIYHNPNCSKSRQTLKLLEERGVAPRIIEYLKEPPSADEFRRILHQLGMRPRDLLRTKDARAAGLDATTLSDDQLIDGMVANPIVIQRPIVINGDRARLGRPPEAVLTIL